MPSEEVHAALAARVRAFLEAHAKTAGDYDPVFDAPSARYNGPDSASFQAAADALANGEEPWPVLSSWGSGCYRGDRGAQAEHDALVVEVNALARRPRAPR
jgi:hypothetical protein